MDDPMTPRVLKPGPRPFVASGVIFALSLVLIFSIVPGARGVLDVAKTIGGLILMYGFLCFLISRRRIIVTESGIIDKGALRSDRQVDFRDIVASVPLILAEPEHPVYVKICGVGKQSAEDGEPILVPLLRIGLKAFRREDVAWFLSLAELKVSKRESG